MIKLILMGFLSILVISSLIVAGILLINLDVDKVSDGILYTFPISIVEKTYVIGVRSNYSSAPEVSCSDFTKFVSVDFEG